METDRSISLAVWCGTEEELRRLRAAVEQNCSCVVGIFGSRRAVCGAHRMLVDQRLLDHLLFVSRTIDAFAQAEQSDDTGAVDVPLGDAAVLGSNITHDAASGLASVTESGDPVRAWRPQER
jgi:hypothetical protein